MVHGGVSMLGHDSSTAMEEERDRKKEAWMKSKDSRSRCWNKVKCTVLYMRLL